MKSILLGTAAAALLSAGGFFLTIGDPAAQSDPAAKAAFVIVRPDGCHNPESATVTASAEAIINGVRKSVPLQVHRVHGATYAINRDWPANGAWVVHVTAKEGDRETHSLIPAGPNGFDRSKVRSKMGPIADQELVAMLR